MLPFYFKQGKDYKMQETIIIEGYVEHLRFRNEENGYTVFNLEMKQDEITCIGECNPLHGPRVEALIRILEEGRTPEKFSYVEEGLYAHDDTVSAVTVGDKTYRVQRVDSEICNENAY